MKMVYEKPAAKDMGEKSEDYFKPLVGTRHIDPDDGLQYEVTEVETNQKSKLWLIGNGIIRVNMKVMLMDLIMLLIFIAILKLIWMHLWNLLSRTREYHPWRVTRRSTADVRT
jgi:hypothetical protein